MIARTVTKFILCRGNTSEFQTLNITDTHDIISIVLFLNIDGLVTKIQPGAHYTMVRYTINILYNLGHTPELDINLSAGFESRQITKKLRRNPNTIC
jgi:hypothetical protein